VRFGNDSVRVFRGPPRNLLIDSVLSQFRIEGGGVPRIFGDSVLFFRADGAPGAAGATGYTLRPGDVVASSFATGMRSVAGAELSELNPGLAEYFGVLDGVLVLDARDGTPAARAGIRAGDVIVLINGEKVTSVADVRRTMAAAPAAAPVPIRVLRRGQHIDLSLAR
jgi:membrane-associated protease RseP (regulator of RpoE activity)